MSRESISEEQLDVWLADVPELKDRGFTQTASARLRRLDAQRRWVFISLGLSWALLCVLFAPFTTLESVNQLIFGLADSLPQSLEELQTANLIESVLNSSLLLPIVSVALGVYALISMQFRKI